MGPIIINVFCMLNGFFKQDHDLSSFMANKIFDSIKHSFKFSIRMEQ